MNTSDQAWQWDAETVTTRVLSGEVSCIEVADGVLARIDTVNPRLNAVVDEMVDEARAAAEGPLSSTATLGLPGLAVPVGVHDGLPTGVQLIASRYREDLLLAAGEMIESRSVHDVLEQVPG